MVFFISKDKALKMLWKITKNEKQSFLVGTAHFFPYSVKKSLRRLMDKIDIVLIEGPLDESNMDAVRQDALEKGALPSLYDALPSEVISFLNKELDVSHSSSSVPFVDLFHKKTEDILKREIDGLKGWMAFFKIWSYFLGKRGWTYSVDLEALDVARQMGKEIYYLETIEEQIAALNGIPFEGIVNFFNCAKKWEYFAKRHAETYLRGDYESMIRETLCFPTRCESIIEKRDPKLFERMMPYVERGCTGVFVGTTHIGGIIRMLEKEGYIVSQCRI